MLNFKPKEIMNSGNGKKQAILLKVIGKPDSRYHVYP